MHAQPTMNHGPRLEIGERQNLLITEAYIDYTTARDKHWNITAAESHLLHEQLKKQYAKTNEMLRTFLKLEL